MALPWFFIRRWAFFCGLGLSLAGLCACGTSLAGRPGVFLPDFAFPIQSSGVHGPLPLEHSHIVPWGTSPDAVRAAATWFEQIGLVVVPGEQLKPFLHQSGQGGSSPTEETVLQAAEQAGAHYVAFVTVTSPPSGTDGQAELRVAVRGMDVKRRHVDWSGEASLAGATAQADQLRAVTRSALAAAWDPRAPLSREQLAALRYYQRYHPAIDVFTSNTAAFGGGPF